MEQAEDVRLTHREAEVLRLLAKGWRNRRIADELGICEGTVKTHVEHIIGKIGAECRGEAAAWCAQNEGRLPAVESDYDRARPYVDGRLAEGCWNARQIAREINARGLNVGRRWVEVYVQLRRKPKGSENI